MTPDAVVVELPTDPTTLLDKETIRDLHQDLERIARERREAEVDSASLRLA